MITKKDIPCAEWTDDFQGKKDFGGPIVSVSTRYWPRGGGFMVVHADGSAEHNEDRPEVKPSAKSAIVFNYINSKGGPEDIELVTNSFTAETELEVKWKVEKWVDKEFRKIAEHMKLLYP